MLQIKGKIGLFTCIDGVMSEEKNVQKKNIFLKKFRRF